jgi:hypothetical protein
MYSDEEYIKMEEGYYNITDYISDKMEQGFLYFNPFGFYMSR